jgi:hypothetical protein
MIYQQREIYDRLNDVIYNIKGLSKGFNVVGTKVIDSLS